MQANGSSLVHSMPAADGPNRGTADPLRQVLTYGPIQTRELPASSWTAGPLVTVPTPGVLVRLDATGRKCRRLVIRALTSNTAAVFVHSKATGASTSEGWELWAGDREEFLIDNTNRIWIDATNAGDGVRWRVEQP